MKDPKGIALILAVGILAVLAAIATSFALNMRLEYKAAMNYYNGVKARYLAEAALQRAIAELKAEVKSNAFDYLGEIWAGSSPSYHDDLDGDSTYDATSTIADEQRKINTNNANQTLLENLFDQLALPAGTTSTDLRSRVLNTSLIPQYYNSLQELKSKAGLTDAELNAIKDHVTVYSYVDANASSRSPININTAERQVLKAVLRGLGSMPQVTADSLADQIYDRVRGASADPFTSWGEFNSFINTNASAYATQIKNNCNPNSTADKVTTEFCFHSGGYYSITATGITDGAEKTLTAIVKIYDIYNATTKADFENPDLNGGSYERVTWLDNCPVNSSALFGNPSALVASQPITGSIKLGYWDNFDEDRTYTGTQWLNESFGSGLGVIGDTLRAAEGVRCDLWNTAGNYWTWDNFSLRVYVNEYNTTNASLMKDVTWLVLREADGPMPSTNAPAVMHTRNGALTWDNTGYGYRNVDVNLLGEEDAITFLSVAQYMAQTGYGEAEAIADRWRYGNGQVRIFNSYANNNIENYENNTYRAGLDYSSIKTFNIRADGSTIYVDVWDNFGNHVAFSRTIPTLNPSGRVVLYSNNVRTAFDNLRIIPDDGSYTSQAINPLGGSNVEWGTITGTLTQSSTDSAKQGDITLQTSVSGTSNVSLKTAVEPALAIGGTALPSIQYTANLSSGAGDTDMRETPVLEDVTITYLPETEIVSYTFSSQ